MFAATIGCSTCSVGGSVRGIDLLKPSAESGEGAHVRVDGGTAQVLEEVVVDVNAVRARLAWQDFIEIGEVIVDKVGKRLRWVHA